MKHKWTRNLSLKLLSLLVAFLIWILIDNIDDPTRSRLFRDVPIQVMAVSRAFFLASWSAGNARGVAAAFFVAIWGSSFSVCHS